MDRLAREDERNRKFDQAVALNNQLQELLIQVVVVRSARDRLLKELGLIPGQHRIFRD